MFSVKDKIVVITGGEGKLGAQFAETLLSHGAKVVSIDLAKPLRRNDECFLSLRADVTQKEQMLAALEDVMDCWGRSPYGLINCAAIDSPPDAPAELNGPFEEYPEEAWDKVITINTKGTFIPCQVFGAQMAKVGEGAIVNISSIYGLVSPDQRIYEHPDNESTFFKPVAYSVSKSGIFNLSRYLATYWGKSGVRVNTLTLGGVFSQQNDNFLKNYSNKVPMGRMANEDEYNGAIIFLLSSAGSYMTGSNLIIDGGLTAW